MPFVVREADNYSSGVPGEFAGAAGSSRASACEAVESAPATSTFIEPREFRRLRIFPAQETSPKRNACLLSKAELAYERPVAIDVFAIEVVEQTATLTDQLQQPASGAVVVFVLAQVLRQLGNPCCQECDLNFRRSVVVFVSSVFFNDRGAI